MRQVVQLVRELAAVRLGVPATPPPAGTRAATPLDAVTPAAGDSPDSAQRARGFLMRQQGEPHSAPGPVTRQKLPSLSAAASAGPRANASKLVNPGSAPPASKTGMPWYSVVQPPDHRRQQQQQQKQQQDWEGWQQSQRQQQDDFLRQQQTSELSPHADATSPDGRADAVTPLPASGAAKHSGASAIDAKSDWNLHESGQTPGEAVANAVSSSGGAGGIVNSSSHVGSDLDSSLISDHGGNVGSGAFASSLSGSGVRSGAGTVGEQLAALAAERAALVATGIYCAGDALIEQLDARLGALYAECQTTIAA